MLEAHVGEPSPRWSILEPVLNELERRGVASRPASIVALLGDRIALPGIVDRERTVEQIFALGERGLEAFDQAEYAEAVSTLSVAVEQIKRNPGLLVLDASHARSAFRAFVGLALSQAKIGDEPGSVETMTELLRTFTTQTISRAEYGPQAEQLYRSIQHRAEAMKRGQLIVTVDEPRAMIFVNGELRGTGRVAVTGLIPGGYRIFIQVPGSVGRQYRVSVRAEDTSGLDVDWQTDAALTVADAWAGFAFATAAERASEARYAGALARRWGQDTIAVVDATQVGDAPVVVGTLYRANGDIARRAMAVPGSSPSQLYALARFLADGTPSAELRMGLTAEETSFSASIASREPSTVPAWPFFTGGLAALGAGIVLFAIDQDYGHTENGVRTPYYRNSRPFGIAAASVGTAAVSVGVWLVLTRHRSRPSVAIASSQFLVSWLFAY